MIYCHSLSGLEVQTGDILCLAFFPEETIWPGHYWRLLGLLVPGEVDHVAVYVGPGGRCVEASARGVYTFDVEENTWQPEKMVKHRGDFRDQLVGSAYPLHGLDLAHEKEKAIRMDVAAYCLAQASARKPYNINLFNPDREDAFYCSQLAYKAYLPHGINLNTGLGVPNLAGTEQIVFPQEIWQGCYHLRVEAGA
jgi:hypothetical protein